jgi:hypothetical protein
MKPPIDQQPWRDLSPGEMIEREKALEVLKEMRKTGGTLDNVFLPKGMTRETVVRHVRSALQRSKDTWLARPYDTISRALNIIENGQIRSIEVNDSEEASKVGRYGNAVKKYLETADESALEPFVGMQVWDSSGRLHTLETRPKQILEALRRSSTGTYEVY